MFRMLRHPDPFRPSPQTEQVDWRPSQKILSVEKLETNKQTKKDMEITLTIEWPAERGIQIGSW